MKFLARRVMPALLVAAFLLAGRVQAQVLKQVPSNAMVVLKVNNLAGVNKKLGDFFQSLGLVQMSPELADPLASLQKETNLNNGLNKDGDMAVAFIDPGGKGNSDKSVIALIPTNDYKALLSNFSDAKTDGDITEVKFPNDPDSSYVANWGGYAVISPDKDLVSKKPEGIAPEGLTAKELDGKDMVLYANMKQIRTRVLPELQKNRGQIMDQLDSALKDNAQMSKFSPAIKVLVGRLLDASESILKDSNAATLSANLGDKGVAFSLLADFAKDSSIGTNIAKVKNTDASLLAGLPTGTYILFGGSTVDPNVANQTLSYFLDPVEKELQQIGDDAKPILDYTGALRTMVSSETGAAYGFVAPAGQVGQEPLFQFVSVLSGTDSKKLLDAQAQMYKSQQDLMKTFGGAAANNAATTTVTANAKTIEGVSFTQYQTTFNINAQTPAEMQAQQFVQFMYGPNGLNLYTGAVNDKTAVTASGVSDQMLTSLVQTAKKGDDPLASSDAVKAVAEQLPKQRVMATYFALDQLVQTGVNAAKQMGIPVPVQLPPNLPPIGTAVSTDGSVVRVDTYVPTDLIQSITAAGMQMYMQARQGMQGGGGGGL